MKFLNPMGLILGILLPIIIFLHMKKEKQTTVDVPTLFLWYKVFEEMESTGRRKLNKTLLMILQLIIGIIFVIFLSEPVIGNISEKEVLSEKLNESLNESPLILVDEYFLKNKNLVAALNSLENGNVIFVNEKNHPKSGELLIKSETSKDTFQDLDYKYLWTIMETKSESYGNYSFLKSDIPEEYFTFNTLKVDKNSIFSQFNFNNVIIKTPYFPIMIENTVDWILNINMEKESVEEKKIKSKNLIFAILLIFLILIEWQVYFYV